MASKRDDYGPLRQHVANVIENKQAQWEQLRWYIDQSKDFPREDFTWIIKLGQEKSILQRTIRKKIKQLRRQHRRAYSARAAQTVKDWRQDFDRGLARAKPYQRDISNLMKREVSALQSVYTSVKKMRMMIERMGKRVVRRDG